MKRERRVDEKGGFGRACGRDVVVLRVNVLATRGCSFISIRGLNQEVGPVCQRKEVKPVMFWYSPLVDLVESGLFYWEFPYL